MNINEFLKLMWIHLAPYAYEKYLKDGRGAVFIDVSKFKFTPQEDNWVDIQGSTRYLALKNSNVLDMVDRETGKQIKTYKPETHICFIFTDGGKHDPIFLKCALAEQPSPKELYEAGKQTPQ